MCYQTKISVKCILKITALLFRGGEWCGFEVQQIIQKSLPFSLAIKCIHIHGVDDGDSTHDSLRSIKINT